MPKSERKPPEEFSRTKRKNEMLALQVMGKSLVDLPKLQLAKLPIPDILLEAIHLAHTLKSHEAQRRHLQYIGKVMREIDLEPIQQGLAKIQLTAQRKTIQFHHVEKWRDDLIAEGDLALQKFMDLRPTADRQKLRQLIRKIQSDQAKNKDTGASTELFRYLRQVLEEDQAS